VSIRQGTRKFRLLYRLYELTHSGKKGTRRRPLILNDLRIETLV